MELIFDPLSPAPAPLARSSPVPTVSPANQHNRSSHRDFAARANRWQCPVSSASAGVSVGFRLRPWVRFRLHSLPFSATDGCPPNEFVYMKDAQIATCDPFNPPNAPCPTGYSCQWSLSNQRYQCCGATAINAPKTAKSKCLLRFRDIPEHMLTMALGGHFPFSDILAHSQPPGPISHIL